MFKTVAVALALALSTTAPVFADGYAAENARCSVQTRLAVDKLQSMEGDSVLDAKKDVRSFYAPRLKSCVMVIQRRDDRGTITQESWVDPTSFSDRGRATIYADYGATEDGTLDSCFFYRDASTATRYDASRFDAEVRCGSLMEMRLGAFNAYVAAR